MWAHPTTIHAIYILAQWTDSGPTSITGWAFSPNSAYVGDLAYQDLGNGGGEIVVSNLTATPEPAPASLAFLGAIGLLLRRRKDSPHQQEKPEKAADS